MIAGAGTKSMILKDSTVLVRNGDVLGGNTLRSFSGSPTINNAGKIAYLATDTANRTGVYTLDSLVVLASETIDGITLQGFGTSSSINDIGDVVFMGSDGTRVGSGIFHRNPD